MDRNDLDTRCVELKARMLALRGGDRENRDGSALHVGRPQPVARTAVSAFPLGKPIPQTPADIRNPHSLVKTALVAVRDVPEDYGKLQFRRIGCLDVRVSKLLVKRALAIMDRLIKRAGEAGLNIQLAARNRGYYEGFRQYTYVSDGREQVQITVTEKTFQRENPAWREKTRYSVPRHLYDPSGRLTLILDDDSYHWDLDRARKWSDAKGHVVEERIDDAISSIREALQCKRETRIRIEQERQREVERQRIRAEEMRQERDEEHRFEGLKNMAAAWSQCEQLRSFIAAWERATETKHGPILSGSPEDGWRRWAIDSIDKVDPLVDS
jgi:hypothetical protein